MQSRRLSLSLDMSDPESLNSSAFPVSLHQRSRYLSSKVTTCTIQTKVVCSKCHTLYDYDDCIDKGGSSSPSNFVASVFTKIRSYIKLSLLLEMLDFIHLLCIPTVL